LFNDSTKNRKAAGISSELPFLTKIFIMTYKKFSLKGRLTGFLQISLPKTQRLFKIFYNMTKDGKIRLYFFS